MRHALRFDADAIDAMTPVSLRRHADACRRHAAAYMIIYFYAAALCHYADTHAAISACLTPRLRFVAPRRLPLR